MLWVPITWAVGVLTPGRRASPHLKPGRMGFKEACWRAWYISPGVWGAQEAMSDINSRTLKVRGWAFQLEKTEQREWEEKRKTQSLLPKPSLLLWMARQRMCAWSLWTSWGPCVRERWPGAALDLAWEDYHGWWDPNQGSVWLGHWKPHA